MWALALPRVPRLLGCSGCSGCPCRIHLHDDVHLLLEALQVSLDSDCLSEVVLQEVAILLLQLLHAGTRDQVQGEGGELALQVVLALHHGGDDVLVDPAVRWVSLDLVQQGCALACDLEVLGLGPGSFGDEQVDDALRFCLALAALHVASLPLLRVGLHSNPNYHRQSYYHCQSHCHRHRHNTTSVTMTTTIAIVISTATTHTTHTHTHTHTLHTTNYTLHTTHCTLHTTHYTLHTIHYTLHTTSYTLHTTHYTLHTIHYTLHTTSYTLGTQTPPTIQSHTHTHHTHTHTHTTHYTLHPTTHYTLHTTHYKYHAI